MPLPIVPALLGADKTDYTTAQEIKTGAVQSAIDDKVDSLKASASDALGNILAGVGQVLDKALPAAAAAAATLQFKGTQSSFTSFLQPAAVITKCRMLTADNSDRIGYPSHVVATLTNYTGFVLCENAAVPISGTVEEESAIEEFMNRGFFIE